MNKTVIKLSVTKVAITVDNEFIKQVKSRVVAFPLRQMAQSYGDKGIPIQAHHNICSNKLNPNFSFLTFTVTKVVDNYMIMKTKPL